MTRLLVLFCFLSCPFFSPLFSQEKIEFDREATFDFEFEGGSVASLIKYSKTLPQMSWSLVADARAFNKELPPFSLKSVTIDDFIEVLVLLGNPELSIESTGKGSVVVIRKNSNESGEEEASGIAFDISFSGGNLKELATELQKKGKINLVISEDAGEIPIPKIDLFSVQVVDVFEILRTLLVPYKVSINRINHTIILSIPSGILIQRKKCSVHYVGDLLATYKIEDVVTAIDTGWKMNNSKTDSSFKYHKETSMLVAYGTTEELRVVEEVIIELRAHKQAKIEIVPPSEMSPPKEKGR